MTITTVATERGYGTVDCDGAQVRAQCRHLATVVTVRGQVDLDNVDAVSATVRRFFVGSNPVVLDLCDVSDFAAGAVSLLHEVDEASRVAGLEWTLVADRAVIELLDDETFPVADSVREALRNLAEAIVNRRRLVLPLIKKTA